MKSSDADFSKLTDEEKYVAILHDAGISRFEQLRGTDWRDLIVRVEGVSSPRGIQFSSDGREVLLDLRDRADEGETGQIGEVDIAGLGLPGRDPHKRRRRPRPGARLFAE